MLVVEQAFPDQPLEQPARGDFMLQRLEIGLERQRLQRIAVMQPGPHRTEHQRDAERERPGIVLAQHEFERIDRRGGGVGIDAVDAELAQRLERQRLDLAGIPFLDAFEAE